MTSAHSTMNRNPVDAAVGDWIDANDRRVLSMDRFLNELYQLVAKNETANQRPDYRSTVVFDILRWMVDFDHCRQITRAIPYVVIVRNPG